MLVLSYFRYNASVPVKPSICYMTLCVISNYPEKKSSPIVSVLYCYIVHNINNFHGIPVLEDLVHIWSHNL